MDDDTSAWTYGHYIGTDKLGQYVLDAMAWPGSSGSGVMNVDGELVGILRGAVRPGYCNAGIAQINFQNVVDCLGTITLARSGIEVVPVGAIPQ